MRLAFWLLPVSRSIVYSQILRSSSVSWTVYCFIQPSPRQGLHHARREFDLPGRDFVSSAIRSFYSKAATQCKTRCSTRPVRSDTSACDGHSTPRRLSSGNARPSPCVLGLSRSR